MSILRRERRRRLFDSPQYLLKFFKRAFGCRPFAAKCRHTGRNIGFYGAFRGTNVTPVRYIRVFFAGIPHVLSTLVRRGPRPFGRGFSLRKIPEARLEVAAQGDRQRPGTLYWNNEARHRATSEVEPPSEAASGQLSSQRLKLYNCAAQYAANCAAKSSTH
jgi:hypothetical protein